MGSNQSNISIAYILHLRRYYINTIRKFSFLPKQRALWQNLKNYYGTKQ